MMKNYSLKSKKNDKKISFLLLLTLLSFSVFSSEKEKDKTLEPPTPSLFFNTPEYITLTIDSGLNEDVIANGTGETINSTTSDIDGTGYCFLEQGLVTSNGNAPTTYGLDPSGFYDLTDQEEGAIYQFADYGENNSLRLSNETEMSGTLTFSNGGTFQNLYILATSGGADSDFDVEINFDDNTSQTITGKLAPDWFNNTTPPAVITGIGRVSTTDDVLQNPLNNPRIYHITLDIEESNYSKTIESIAITKTNTDGFLNVFAVSAKTSADCLSPTNLAVDNITTSEAELSWVAGDTEESWEIAIQLAGMDTPESGTEVSETTYNFNDLETNTEYEIFLRSYCGTEGSYSFWTSTTFTTACGLLDGLEEGFESSSEIPSCWEIINDGDSTYPWEVYTFDSNTGSNSVRIRSDWNSHDDYLISPKFTVNANESDLLSFWAKNSNSTNAQPFDIVVSTTGKAKEDFTDVIATQVSAPENWNEYSYDLSAYVGQDIYVAFKNTSTSSLNFYYLYIDDVNTSGIPLCPAPTNLNAPLVTNTNAQLTWETDGATAWEIAVQPVGTGTPDSGEAVTTNTYDVAIDPSTVYEFYVRVDCSEVEGFSPWTGPYAFGVYSKLQPNEGFTDDVIANGIGAPSSSTTNDVDGANYAYMSEDYQYDIDTPPVSQNGDGLPLNGDLTKEGGETSGLHFQMSPFDNPYEGNNSLRLENVSDNGTFTFNNTQPAESLHLMVTSGSGSAEMTGTITFNDGSTQAIENTSVPDWYFNETPPVIIRGIGRLNLDTEDVETSTTNPRIYELEITIDEANQSKSISELFFEKSSGDGVINIFGASIKLAETPSCSVPTLVQFSNITTTSAQISWTSNGDETEWEILYGPTGFDPETQGTTATDDDQEDGYSLNDLEPDTEYDVYIRAVCEEENYSEWSTVTSFSTLESCETPTGIEFSNITTTSAQISWTSNGDETEWEILYGPTGFDPETQGTTATDDDQEDGYSLNDLEPDTEYDVYIRAVCEEESYSEWSTVASFSTEELDVNDIDFSGFMYYPNPVRNMLTFKANNPIKSITVFNMLGQQVFQKDYNKVSGSIDFSMLQTGNYFIKIQIKNSIKMIKLIKE